MKIVSVSFEADFVVDVADEAEAATILENDLLESEELFFTATLDDNTTRELCLCLGSAAVRRRIRGRGVEP